MFQSSLREQCLFVAAALDSPSAVDLLAEAGAVLGGGGASNAHGCSPLHRAAEKGAAAAAAALLRRGADPNAAM